MASFIVIFLFHFRGFLALATTAPYMKSSAENKQFLFGLTQAEFINFTIYLFIGNCQI